MNFTNKGRIIRNCLEKFDDYHMYKKYLEADFYHKCAYCDISDSMITTPFEIDHFIPINTFEGIRDDLKTDYNNLVLSCKKCNNSKRSKFKGNITSANVTNELFYDPVLIDYNTIFYRNEVGQILSSDAKGKNMIQMLKLYRPIHSTGWVVEKVKSMISLLGHKIDAELNELKKAKLTLAQEKLKIYHSDLFSIFIANYNID